MTQLPSIYFPENNPELDAIYQNEITNGYYSWPLIYTRQTVSSSASGLANNDPAVYYTYSGGVDWQYTTVSKQKDGRYRNITVRSVSGDSFKFYLHTALSPDEVYYHAGPVTESGSYYTLTRYASADTAEANAVTFTSGMNSGVLSLSGIEFARSITLAHQAVTSGGTYRLYQFLPRTSIEVDDLSAEIIDVVTLRVSDSIVVSPTIADKSITGAKILDGTVSGVLITPGTITANEIAAGSITGSRIAANTISGALITAGTITSDKLQVDQLDAIAANMGTLVVNSGVSIGDNGKLYVGSGEYTALNASGLVFKNPVSNAGPNTFPTTGDFTIRNVQQYAPDVNSIKFAPYFYDASGILYDYDPPRYSTIISQRQYKEQGQSLTVAGNYSTFAIDSGWIPSESGQAYYVPTSRSNVYLSSKSSSISTMSLSTTASTASGFISMFNNQITISGTGSDRLLKLAMPTKVTSASFVIVKQTPTTPGFPPIETYLQEVTATDCNFDVTVSHNNNVYVRRHSVDYAAGTGGVVMPWNTLVYEHEDNDNFLWSASTPQLIGIVKPGVYIFDIVFQAGTVQNGVQLYVNSVPTGRMANYNASGNQFRHIAMRYFPNTGYRYVEFVLLPVSSTTVRANGFAVTGEGPILTITKVA